MKYAYVGSVLVLAMACAGGDDGGTVAAAGSGSVIPGNYDPPPVYTPPARPEETRYDVCVGKVSCANRPGDRSLTADSLCRFVETITEDESVWNAWAQTYLTSHPNADEPPSMVRCNYNTGTQDIYLYDDYLRDAHSVSGEPYTCRCSGSVHCTALAPAEPCVRKWVQDDPTNPDYAPVTCDIGARRPCLGLHAREGVVTCISDVVHGSAWGYCDTGAR